MSTYNISLPLSYRQALNFGKQSRAGALGLLAYDHIINLDKEIELIWRQGGKHRLGFWLYIVNRFLPFFWLIFDTIPLTPSGVVRPRTCIIYLMCDDIVTVLTTISVQSILQLRVYALYERSKKILLFLCICCAVEVSVMVIFVGVTMAHISHLPVQSTATGCYYSGIFSVSALFWLPALVFEPVLCLLVLWKSWGEDALEKWRLDTKSKLERREMSSQVTTTPLVKRLAKESLVYFVVIFVELMGSTLIWALFNRDINIIMPWSCALPSILGSRLFLNMREVVLITDKDSDRSYVVETLVFCPSAAQKLESGDTYETELQDRLTVDTI